MDIMDAIIDLKTEEMIDKLRYTLIAADIIACEAHITLEEISRILESYGFKMEVKNELLL